MWDEGLVGSTLMNVRAVRRQPNPRGQGGLLRAEILAAAADLLEETGNEDAVSLRALAKRIGITAPAIYGHFVDRDAILAAVVELVFADLFSALVAAAERYEEPVDRLRAICLAYLDFARSQPGRFRVLFDRRREGASGIPNAVSVESMIGGNAFSMLTSGIENCIRAGRSTSTDVVRDATLLWIGLHGYASLRAGVPYFPWPPTEELVDDLLSRFVRA